MFDIGWSEILVVVIITILVVGPKELPGLLRTVGKTVGNMRRMAGDFQNQFNEALKEAELDDVQKTIADVRKMDPRTAVKDAVSKQLTSVEEASEDISSAFAKNSKDINEALADKAEPSESAEPIASESVSTTDDEVLIASEPVEDTADKDKSQKADQ